jgi:hypothetical protein
VQDSCVFQLIYIVACLLHAFEINEDLSGHRL